MPIVLLIARSKSTKVFIRYGLLILFFILFLCNILLAQSETAVVAGVIKDKDGIGIPRATAALVSATDSIVRFSVASDSAGYFQIDRVREGVYRLKVTSIGYSTYWSDLLKLAASDSIFLNPVLSGNHLQDLQQIVVKGRRPLFEQKLDRTVMNVDAIISNAGSDALDLLEKMPGVTVDREGNISVRGRQNVMIVIDGKPTYLTGTALISLLRSMNANGINRIELMTNPGAKYDASGSAGIINFVTKKSNKAGFNGDASLGYGQGRYWKTFNNLNLNFKKNKLNLYLNGNINADRNFFDLSDHQQIYSQDNNVTVDKYLNQHTYFNDRNANSILRIGLDYDISPLTTIGVSFSGFVSPASSDYTTNATLLNSFNRPDSFLVTEGHTSIRWNNRMFNPYFVHRFDSLSEISGDVSYMRYASTTDQDILNTDLDSSHTIILSSPLQIRIPFTVDIYTGRLDYGRTIKGIGKLELGLKMIHTQTKSAARYFTPDGFGLLQLDSNASNQFSYWEFVNAGYLNLSKRTDNWDYELGLRYELTNARGNRFGNAMIPDSIFDIRYAYLFPSLSVGFKAADNHYLSFSMSRRIDRPAYNDLNPFTNYKSRYVLDQGNPFLQPQLSYNFELNHKYKELLFTRGNFSYTDNQFVPLLKTQDNITRATPGNFGSAQTIGISSTLQLNLLSWWMFSFTAFGSYNTQAGIANDLPIRYDFWRANLNFITQFQLGHGWLTELSGFYNTRNQFGQFVVNGMGDLSVAISKSLLRDKGSLKLNLRDVFYTRIFDAYIDIDGKQGFQKVSEHVIRTSDTRRLNITFTYRFGKSTDSKRTKPRQ